MWGPMQLHPHPTVQIRSELSQWDVCSFTAVTCDTRVSVFCFRLEETHVTKHKQSTIQILNLWNLSTDLTSKSGNAVILPFNN